MVSGRATAATTTAVEADLEARVQQHLRYSLGATWHHATPGQIAAAIALAVREPVIDRLIATSARQQAVDAKRVYYLSIEFLMGRALGNTLCNLGINELWTGAAARAGIALSDVLEAEPDAALGNGGLGRLAACFLDSMATLDLPGWGYGINYEFGLFQQRFDDGFQRERLER
jgi:starch phosphorylase